MQGVLWPTAYAQIALFERMTGKHFESGLQVACRVIVRFHPRFGLKLDVQEIDASFTIGQLELDRQLTLEKLLKNYPHQIRLVHDEYHTANNQLKLPWVLQRVALIGAAGSDGIRDFEQELLHNQYGYHFSLTVFHASVQGQYAVGELCAQLDHLHQIASSFDVVALVRGGGSNTDFAAFDEYEVARRIAVFPIPVFTGIGHDRNISIADMMGWPYKTPTKVAAAIVDLSLRFDSDLHQLTTRMEDAVQARLLNLRQSLKRWDHLLHLAVPHRLQRRQDKLLQYHQHIEKCGRDRVKIYKNEMVQWKKDIFSLSKSRLQNMRQQLQHTSRLVEQLSPETILNRGFAMVMQEGKIITDASQLNAEKKMTTRLRNATIESEIKSMDYGEG
jgi:exodeoxyribonuclease VII large subunit